MQEHGAPFIPIYDRQSYLVDGRRVFWGGLTNGTEDGGFGLIDGLGATAGKLGATMEYGARARSLLVDEHGAVTGVEYTQAGRRTAVDARAIVLAWSGFEGNVVMRTR